jgi:hypothetical protein
LQHIVIRSGKATFVAAQVQKLAVDRRRIFRRQCSGRFQLAQLRERIALRGCDAAGLGSQGAGDFDQLGDRCRTGRIAGRQRSACQLLDEVCFLFGKDAAAIGQRGLEGLETVGPLIGCGNVGKSRQASLQS